jgi:hypothetical protein
MQKKQDDVVYAMFDKQEDLEAAFQELVKEGVQVEDLSVLMTEETHDRDFRFLDRTRTREGIAAGSVLGGAIGGVIGGLAALGAAMTGVGTIVIGHAVAFAAAGGVLGGVMGHAVPEEEAQRLRDALHRGKVLMCVHVKPSFEHEAVERVLARFHGEELGAAGSAS